MKNCRSLQSVFMCIQGVASVGLASIYDGHVRRVVITLRLPLLALAATRYCNQREKLDVVCTLGLTVNLGPFTFAS